MELPEVVSVRKFREFNNRQKEELYETLLDLAEAIEEIPKKSLRRTLDLSLAVLRHKGDQASALRERLEAKTNAESSDDSHDERLLGENERLKRLLVKLEEEKSELKHKMKALTDEVLQLQQRLQEAAHTAETSDKESTDPLSELDKQEELLRNIDMKNKHIKRLLKDIESLQNQNIEQSKSIIVVERELQHARTRQEQLLADLALADGECKALKDRVNELNVEITRLEGNITYLEEERERSELELKDFIDKLEAKAQSWKAMLDHKDAELKKLRLRVGPEVDVAATEAADETELLLKTSIKSEDELEEEHTKLMHVIEARDKLIEQLELKVKAMAEEMVASTKVMNALSAERAQERDPQKPRSCCRTTEQALQAANTRCADLSEMLARAEEDNTQKSQQAVQALEALHAYERGEDGLVKALRRCGTLEQKLTARDKRVRTLITELNSLHEIAQENAILRKRLNIPDDVVVTAKNLSAKERQKTKIIDRLTLKLRASEEIRLQLQLDKAELRRQLIQQQQPEEQQTKNEELATSRPTAETQDCDVVEAAEILSLPSEIGEVPDSAVPRTGKDGDSGSCGVTLIERNVCANCQQQFNQYFLDDGNQQQQQTIAELQTKYQDVLQENETLRLGMLEILEKLREYDDASEHITIDSEVLYRLLAVLQQQHSPAQSTPKRLQSELNTLKEREEALRELLQQTQNSLAQGNDDDDGNGDISMETDELASIEEPRDRRTDDDELVQLPIMDGMVDTSTRPTTPNMDVVLPIITAPADSCERLRYLEQQVNVLRIYRQHYEQLQARLLLAEDGAGEGDSKERAYVELQQQLLTSQLELSQERSSYAYMREDYDRCLTQSKQAAAQHIQQTAELKQLLLEAQQHEQATECEAAQQRHTYAHSREEYETLLQSNAELRAQLAQHVQHALNSGNGGNGPDTKFKDICADYGIIEENLQLDYVPRAEYAVQREQLTTANAKQEELRRKSLQLEQLLLIAQEQIQTQQRLLNEFTDNHIDLRHLVADLQSASEDKFLLAKMQRDLDAAKIQVTTLSAEHATLQQKYQHQQSELGIEQQLSAQLKQNCQKELQHKDLKIKFLMKSMHLLREKYAKFTPLIFLTNFIYAYKKFVQKTELFSTVPITDDATQALVEAKVLSIVQAQQHSLKPDADDAQHLIKLIKAETQAKLMEENCALLRQKSNELQKELEELRLRHAHENEHWKTVQAIFVDEERKSDNVVDVVTHVNAAVNTDPVAETDAMPNTPPVPAERKISPARIGNRKMVDKQLSPIASPTKRPAAAKSDSATQTNDVETPTLPSLSKVDTEMCKERPTRGEVVHAHVQTTPKRQADQSAQTLKLAEKEQADVHDDIEMHTLEQKLQEAQNRSINMEQLLNKTSEDLNTAQDCIKALQQQLQDKKRPENTTANVDQPPSTATTEYGGIVENTILSFHTLLTEKDKSITKYQDLLQSEREQHQSAATKLNTELDNLRSTITNLNFNIKTKDIEILELKTKLELVSVRRNSKEKLDLAEGAGGSDNSLNELTDEKIEEMFQHDGTVDGDGDVINCVDKQDTEALMEIPTLLKQIKELKDKACYSEQMLKQKDEELTLLREKINLYRERESALTASGNTELDQVRSLLEEKDKHVNDLLETLNNFHEDQQRYINDSSNDSADRISKLAADLTRTEATNKIYQTQVEAMRRQLNSLTQREKQARELNQSLRNQLIKRPVVSIKTELNARVKQENLQKRIQNLELDLDEARAQIQRQQVIIDTKRARSASEVGLWEKQKRWQQNAEKFKAKLEETECMLEKTRTLLQSARNTVTRLEKEKQVLELKLGRALHGTSTVSNVKCCRTPSCPNLHQGNSTCGHKYTPSESPETCTGGSSDCSSPAHSAPCGRAANALHCHPQGELIEALKARLELQQRKIMAMEMEGKGSNTLTTELEKLQEKICSIEAQNIRLEARNLQLQLDNDLLRQGNENDRLQKRIKHLEDYIIALKEEMAQTEARRQLCKCSGIKMHTNAGQSAEQTILALRNIVEKLRAENKYLKDGKRPCESRSTVDIPSDLNRLQKMYTDSLDKIKTLQMELNIKSRNSGNSESAQNSDELKYVKEQLIKKSQLLQKAKVLLTRAAAKEKVLKEQLGLWKRKCFELQNVPVIDEISE